MKSRISRYVPALLLALLLPPCVFAGVVKGRVTDENGDALPYATVVEKGTTNGTSANGEGYYTLELSDGTHTITAQYMGYRSENRAVTAPGGPFNFKLTPQTLSIGEVTVHANGEDPAYPIMRKVIEKRKYHADLVKTFESDVYLKGNFGLRSVPKKIMGQEIKKEDLKEIGIDTSGKGIVYLLEQMTHYTYQAPDKEYNRVISIRQSGDPRGIGFATMPPITNIYDNNVPIIGNISKRGFISPANSNAFLYYKYQFLGSFMDGDRLINKIKVTPKRKFEPCFSGFVYVVDDEWVFQSVDLKVTRESQMDMLDTLRLEQTYIPVARDLWIIQSQVIYPAVKLFGFDFAGHMITSYKNQLINQPIDPHRFEGRILSSYDSTANDRSLAYWDSIRPIPLAADEKEDFLKKDTLHLPSLNNPGPADTLHRTRVDASQPILTGITIRRDNNTWSLQSPAMNFNYNTVEGIWAALVLDWNHKLSKEKYFNLELRNRYGFSNTHYNPFIRFDYHVEDPRWTSRAWDLSAYGGKYIYQLNGNDPISPFMNSMYTLWGGDNYMKLYEKAYGKIVVRRNRANGFKASAFVSYEYRTPLENSTDYTFIKSVRDNLTPNNPASLGAFERHRAALAGISLSYQPGWNYIQYPKFKSAVRSNAPIFTINYTKGIHGIFDSKSDFDKWSASIEHEVKLRLLGTVNYKLGGGGFLNNKYVGIPDMMHLNGNQTFLATSYMNSFQLAPYYRFSNTADLYGEGHVEWHLNGWLTNKIPGFRRLNWTLVGASNVFYIDPDNYYAEVSVGLENIGFKMFRFGRVDFVAGYESGRDKPYLGLRIGLGAGIFQIAGLGSPAKD